MSALRLNGVTLTPETIQATRQWYADNAQACIAEAESGEVFVNDLPSYIAWRKESAADSLAGKYDHSLSFLQRAYFIQTGISVPILS
jgi:hypothetical protein